MRKSPFAAFALVLALVSLSAACGWAGGSGSDGSGELVVYSGRNQNLIGPLLEQYAEESGVDIRVKYADTGETLATLLEEGEGTRADVFISQDAGALGVLANRGFFADLPDEMLDSVKEGFADTKGRWVGLTGRVRVIAYNTDSVSEEEIPDSVFDVTDPRWKGKVGFPPTNASFIAYVSALRQEFGDERTRQFLEGLKANDAQRFDNNILVLNAIARGEIELGLVNHYYLYAELKEQGDAPVANYYMDGGGEGTFVNLSGVALLKNSDEKDEALRFIRYLLDDKAQRYFRDETSEYPLRKGVDPIEELPALDSLKRLDVEPAEVGKRLESTVQMIKDVGLS